MIGRNIEINRNIIEKFLMKVKDYFRKNIRLVIYSAISIIVFLTIIISGIVYFNHREKNEIKELEIILEKYYSSESDKEKNIQKTINDINNLINSSLWGYVNKNGYYIIAGLYFSVNKHNEGKDYLLKFVNKSPSSFFAPLALHRAGIECEKLNNINEALQLYQRLESEYDGCVISDEIYYDLGRIYHVKGNILKAKEYYNKVILQFPISMYASKAKKRLLLLGQRDETTKAENKKKLAM